MTNAIADKIRKILAKADSTTNEMEAETFMAKAHAMMEEHGLDLLDLGKLDSEDPVGHDLEAFTSSDGWKDKVAGQLARYYGCNLVMVPIKRSSKTYTVFGRQSARITFALMLPYVLRQIAKLGLEEYKLGAYPTQTRALSAIANAMCIRLYRLRTEAEEKRMVSMNAAKFAALVPVNLIELAMAEVYPNLRTTRKNFSTDSRAMRKAEGISLNQQTGASKSALRIGR